MEPIYVQEFEITDLHVDRYGHLMPSKLLYLMQEVAGIHFTQLSMDYDSLAQRNLFWAVTRHKVQISRLPQRGERIRIETWPMPTTRVAYPRSMVAYDEAGKEIFRSITLWVLMDLNTRSMILPGKSGIEVAGTLRGLELASPMGLPSKMLSSHRERTVGFTDLDRNGHMNNTKYLDWIYDLLPSPFHAQHAVKEFTVCYLSETREGQTLDLRWDFPEEGCLQVDAYRRGEEKDERVFAATSAPAFMRGLAPPPGGDWGSNGNGAKRIVLTGYRLPPSSLRSSTPLINAGGRAVPYGNLMLCKSQKTPQLWERLWSFFRATGVCPVFSTVFSGMSVEKPVENVDNSCGKNGKVVHSLKLC